jgi:hypothetical protein
MDLRSHLADIVVVVRRKISALDRRSVTVVGIDIGTVEVGIPVAIAGRCFVHIVEPIY